MSHYCSVRTILRDEAALVAALGDLGDWEIESHVQPQPLFGYEGDKRPERAEIIIRRKFISRPSNDIGFARQSDGTFTAVISDYDRSRFDSAWLGKLSQRYAVYIAKWVMAAQGFAEVSEIAAGGNTIITFASRSGAQIQMLSSGSGNVSLRVRGVKGPACVSLTQALERALGDVTGRTPTEDWRELVEPPIQKGVKA